MKNFRITISIVVILSLLLSGCRKDGDQIVNGTETTSPNTPVELINATFDGLVTDENNNVVVGAEVYIGEEATKTNDIGYYRIKTEVNLNGTKILVRKDGYIDAYANVVPLEDEVNSYKFVLKVKNLLPSINSSSAERVIFDNGNSVQFVPNSFVDNEGQSYNGNVNIYANFIEATSNAFSQYILGDMYGKKMTNEEVLIKSRGVLLLEAFDDFGSRLTINEPAEIRISLDTLPQESTDILSWTLENEEGIWLETAEASLGLGVLILNQKELGYINIGNEVDFVTGQYIIEDLDENAQYLYEINTEAGDYVSSGDMGLNRRIAGKFPKDEEMLMNLYTQCHSFVGTLVLFPLKEGETIIIGFVSTLPGLVSHVIKGNVFDCEMNAVQNGVVVLNLINSQGYQLIVPIENGSFEIGVFQCQANDAIFYELMAIDFENLMESEMIGLEGGELLNTQLITTCSQSQLKQRFLIEFEDGEVYETNSSLETVVQLDGEFANYDIYAYDLEEATGDTIVYTVFFVIDDFETLLYHSEVELSSGEPFSSGYDNLYSLQFEGFEDPRFSYQVLDDFVIGYWENPQILQWTDSDPDENFSLDRGIGKLRFISPIN